MTSWYVMLSLLAVGASFIIGRTISLGTRRDAPLGCPDCGGHGYRLDRPVKPYNDPGYPHIVITHCPSCQLGLSDEDAAILFSEEWGIVTEGMPAEVGPEVWVARLDVYRRKAYPSRINKVKRVR